MEAGEKKEQRMATGLMLSDHLEKSEGEPAQAAKIFQPFGRNELIEAIRRSEKQALEHAFSPVVLPCDHSRRDVR